MAVKTTHIDGDMSLGRNLAMGGKATIAGSTQIGHDLVVKGWLDAPNIKAANKGVFTSLEALEAAYPEPQDGWFAGIGDSTPFAAYTGQDGSWVATGGTIDITTDMTRYTEDIEQLQQDVLDLAANKPDIIDIINYLSTGAILPDSSYYVHAGRPVLSTSGEYYNTRWIGFCMSHFNNLNHSIALYTRNENDRYVFYSQFRADEADTPLEEYVALVFGGLPATPTTPGLMSAADKNMFDDMVTEVFPLTVTVASSNAGTYEVGDAQHSVTPQIVLSITRKGADVSASAQTTSSQGEVQSDKKTIIGSALTSGTTIFQISVTQGGQTVNAPNQVFDFMNYRYYGVINSSTEPTKAQVKTLCENGTLTKQLSRSTKMGATDLAANKCFVFVVPNTSVNLIVKNAKSGNPISGCTVDTVTVNRVNNTGTVSCKYVIVPAGAAAWTFEITN